jgi:AcrR family transcriptional regulator
MDSDFLIYRPWDRWEEARWIATWDDPQHPIQVMRYRTGHKVEVHEKIVKDASRRVRAESLNGAAVSAVMQDAGLTHGGFYKQFQSKDGLLVESLGEAFREIPDTLVRAAEQAPPARRGRQSSKPTCAQRCANVPSARARCRHWGLNWRGSMTG